MNKQNDHLTIKDIPKANKYQLITNQSPKNWTKADILNETKIGRAHV